MGLRRALRGAAGKLQSDEPSGQCHVDAILATRAASGFKPRLSAAAQVGAGDALLQNWFVSDIKVGFAMIRRVGMTPKMALALMLFSGISRRNHGWRGAAGLETKLC